MTTTYHTAITSGAAANASVINAPLAQLDAAIAAVAAQAQAVAAAVILGGAAVTQADGAASAGQKVVTVDNAAIFAAGCGVEYLLVGGTVEYNTVDSVDSETQITLNTNLGTGGIADNGYVSVVPVGLYGLLADPSNALEVTRTSNTEALLVNGSLAGTALFAHAYADNTAFTDTNEGAYASYDARPELLGSTNYNHCYGFEARTIYSGSGTLGTYAGLMTNPTVNGPITNCFGLYLIDPLGTGTITNYYAIYIPDVTRGTSGNYGVYQGGSAPNYFGGKFQTGGAVEATGLVSGSNLVALSANNTLKVGTAFSTADLYYDTLIGHNAGHSLTDGQRNTFLGCGAGYTATGGDGNVFLGFKAGYYETGDNKLFIDNQDRSSEAIARTEALIVGLFTDTSTTQEIRFNVGKMGFFGQAPVAKPTGVAVSAAGVHAALVTLGLIAA